MRGSREDEWKAAKLFMARGPSATLQYLADEPRALLYAYDAQAVEGPCPSLLLSSSSLAMDPFLRHKLEKWRSLGDMPQEEAKRLFVELLTQLLPQWTHWHGRQTEEAEHDEASRILSAFSQKTGLSFRSSL